MMTVHQPNQTPKERPGFFPARIVNGEILLDSKNTNVKFSSGQKTRKKPAKAAGPAVSKTRKEQETAPAIKVRKQEELPYWLL